MIHPLIWGGTGQVVYAYMCVAHVYIHAWGSVIVSQSAETPSVTPSPLLHTHTQSQTLSHRIHEVVWLIEEITLIFEIMC